jgi:hypothetical protein
MIKRNTKFLGNQMTDNKNKAQQVNIFRAARAVLWSFLGIRNKDEAQTDMANLSITQVVVVAIVGVFLFVLTLVLLVNFVTR